MLNFKYVSALLIMILLSGCASMFGDNTRSINVSSAPEGANVYIDGINYGQTPAKVELSSHIWAGKVIMVKKEGYKDMGYNVNSTFQFVGLWNLLFWPGFVVDAVTGNTMKIAPNSREIEVKLNK